MQYAIENQLVKNEGFARWARPEPRNGTCFDHSKRRCPESEMTTRMELTASPRRRSVLSNWFMKSSTSSSCLRSIPSQRLTWIGLCAALRPLDGSDN